MDLFKKNIILSPAHYDGKSEERGILSLQKQNSSLEGSLKCFSLNNKEGKLLLGVNFGEDKVYKFNVLPSQVSNFTFSLPPSLNLDTHISCVLVQIENNEHQPIIWGSTKIDASSPGTLVKALGETGLLEKEDLTKIIKTQKEEVKKPIEIEEDPYIDEEVEECIDKEFEKIKEEEEEEDFTIQSQKQAYKIHKNSFFSPNIKATSTQEALNSKKEDSSYAYKMQKEEDVFFEQVKEQIENLFERFETESALEQILPNSRFVRVNFEGEDEYYIFGIIYDEEGVEEYIVYGVPARHSLEPPSDLQGYYQWLPLDPEKPEEDGYWLMYQSARTGENIKMEII